METTKVKQITKCLNLLSKSRNGEHHNFHMKVTRIVTEELAEAQHLTAQRTPYVAKYLIEDEVYKTNVGYASTKSISEKNKERSEIFLYLKTEIENGTRLRSADKRAAAELLSFVLKPYRSADRKSYMEYTSEVYSLIQDLKREEYTEPLATLGLTEIVTELETVNNEFQTLFDARSGEKHSRKVKVNMKTIRPEVDAAYHELVTTINVLYYANELTEKSDEVRTTLGKLIDTINSYIIELNDAITHRGDGSKVDIPDDPEPKPEEAVITAVYQVEEGNPDKPNEIKKGKRARIEWTGGFELVNETGDGPGDIILRSNTDWDDTVPAENILERSNKYCEFIMTEYLTEGDYTIRIETYDGGSPLVVEYPQTIKLLM